MESKKKNNQKTRQTKLVDLIREISFRVLRQSLSEITEDVYFGLEKIAEIIDADYAYICFVYDLDGPIDIEYAWKSKLATPKKQFIGHEYDYFMSRLKGLEAFHILSAKDIPESAQAEVDYIEKNQIKSLLIVPLEGNDHNLTGYLVFEALSLRKSWDSELYPPIKFFGEILYSSISKARALSFIQSERDFCLVLNYANSLDECLDICLDYILEISGMGCGGIYLVSLEDKSLNQVKTRNVSRQFIENTDNYMSDTFHYKMMSKGKPLYLSWIDLQASEFEIMRNEGITVLSSYPVMFRDELIGIVNVASRDRRVFPEHARLMLETVAPRLGPLWYVFKRDLNHKKEEEEYKVELEKQVYQLQRAESLGRMASAITHRFNNLVMGVLGNLELAKKFVNQDMRAIEKIRLAEKAAQQASDLGKLILTHAGKIESKRMPCNLSETIRDLFPLMQASVPSGVYFSTDLALDLPMISADLDSLNMVILNLVNNAWESFTDGSGIIHLETQSVILPDTFNEEFIDKRKLPKGEYIAMSITDNGSGMDEMTIKQMFEPFFTTKRFRRGLGLSLVMGIVQAHGGDISVLSEKGVSTRITVLLPVAKENEINNDDDQAFEEGKLVLLADDDKSIREVMRQMLENLGCKVLEANNGSQAVELFEKNHSQVTCVLCDIKMPDMDGWQTMEAIQSIRPHTPVILVSGQSLTAKQMKDRPKPHAWIQKPFRMHVLINILKQI